MEFILSIISKLISIYSYALIIYLLMSFFGGARQTPVGQFLARICEPYLEPFRKIIPPIGMIDISPILAFMVLRFASSGLRQLFYWIA
ncbi:YggT family protein [Peribacillus kribbensis]|uniref:YggT family protein n=1 Tax=Peribacillus kribbensis TaxID=356658 RepID=UPI00041640ED|nr:YggT family protein [Peribacillus kribbensis]